MLPWKEKKKNFLPETPFFEVFSYKNLSYWNQSEPLDKWNVSVPFSDFVRVEYNTNIHFIFYKTWVSLPMKRLINLNFLNNTCIVSSNIQSVFTVPLNSPLPTLCLPVLKIQTTHTTVLDPAVTLPQMSQQVSHIPSVIQQQRRYSADHKVYLYILPLSFSSRRIIWPNLYQG